MGRKFLLVDSSANTRELLQRTLARKFPSAEIEERSDAGTAVGVAAATQMDAIIVHRADEMEGVELVRLLRRVDASVPIVMVSGYDRENEAFAAGANSFLNSSEWLRIGTVVAEALRSNS